MPSFNPSTFTGKPDAGSRLISRDQRAFLIAKCIEDGISDGIDLHLVESWIFASFGYDVDDVGDLTRAEYAEILEEQGWMDE